MVTIAGEALTLQTLFQMDNSGSTPASLEAPKFYLGLFTYKNYFKRYGKGYSVASSGGNITGGSNTGLTAAFSALRIHPYTNKGDTAQLEQFGSLTSTDSVWAQKFASFTDIYPQITLKQLVDGVQFISGFWDNTLQEIDGICKELRYTDAVGAGNLKQYDGRKEITTWNLTEIQVNGVARRAVQSEIIKFKFSDASGSNLNTPVVVTGLFLATCQTRYEYDKNGVTQPGILYAISPFPYGNKIFMPGEEIELFYSIPID